MSPSKVVGTCFSAKSLMTSGVLKASEMAALIAFRTELNESITLKSPDSIFAKDISKSLKMAFDCLQTATLVIISEKEGLNWDKFSNR